VREPLDFVTCSLGFADDAEVRKIARDNATALLGVTVP
jgi:hypothetical protein